MDKITRDHAMFSPIGELKAVAIMSAQYAHKEFLRNSDEPLDGDDTERVAKFFLNELNRLNGNITLEEEVKVKIEEMKANDKLTGEHPNATDEDYESWAFEEIEANKSINSLGL